jgi:hypothetical protein
MNFEFLDYLPTPGEKHLGIARVKCWGKIVLRYKIVPKKDGGGVFPGCASYKVVDGGEETYVPAFVLDSNSDREDVEALIRKGVRPYLNGGIQGEQSVHQEQSVPFIQRPEYNQNNGLPF